jgi:hypothetical protein
MNRPARTALSALAVALLAAGVLAGCATATDRAGSGTPSDSTAPETGAATDLELDAAWLDGGRMIGIISQGSSTCVPTAGDVSFANGVIEVEFVDPEADTPCTRDLVSRVTLVATPEGVDPTQEVEIRVTGDGYVGDTDLDGVAGLALGGETDYQPSAGWADDDEVVILTWGSSSCVPVIESVEATSATEATVTFVTPPADQVCTMDIGPRGVVAQIPDLDDDGETFVILQGAEFDNVRVPIIGND